MMKKIRHEIEYVIVKSILILVNLIPYRPALYLGDCLGFLAFSVFRVRRVVTLDNLGRAFGKKYTASEYRKLGLKTYRNFCKSMIEYAIFPSLRKKDISKFITLEGIENLEKVKEYGRGAVLITGHFGSWELMGAFISQKGWSLDYLVGEQHNLKVNKIMNEHRQMFGIGLIEMGVAARGVFKAVKAGRMVAMLSDQDAGSDGAIVSFMGRPASTPKGPAAFALKTGAPLVCGYIIREGYKHRIVVLPALEIIPTGNKDDDIRKLTQAYTALLEKFVTMYPDQWFWAHRRWKSTG